MTEAEWLACHHPTPMLRFVQDKLSDRKQRLFACACCRRIWPLLTDERSRQGVEVSEAFADGQGDPQALRNAYETGWAAAKELIASYLDAAGIDPANDPNYQDGRYDACLAAPAACAAADAADLDLRGISIVAYYACHARSQAAFGLTA